MSSSKKTKKHFSGKQCWHLMLPDRQVLFSTYANLSLFTFRFVVCKQVTEHVILKEVYESAFPESTHVFPDNILCTILQTYHYRNNKMRTIYFLWHLNQLSVTVEFCQWQFALFFKYPSSCIPFETFLQCLSVKKAEILFFAGMMIALPRLSHGTLSFSSLAR